MRSLFVMFAFTSFLMVAGCAHTSDAQDRLTFKNPMVLNELLVWRDGGSLGFVMEDADKERLCFCMDGSIGSATTGYFFLNVTHATEDGGIQLPLDGQREKQLLGYLKSWLETHFDMNDLDKTLASNNFQALTKDEFKAWHVGRVLKNRPDAVRLLRKRIQATGE